MEIKLFKLILAGTTVLCMSCNTAGNNAELDKKLVEIGDDQKVILKKLNAMEKSVANLAIASKNRPADKKQQPPQTDPNKVYNIDIGDSFYAGPANAKVTIIEWMDFQ